MKKVLCCFIIIITCFMVTKVNAGNTFYDTRGTKYEGVVERMARLGIVNGMNETTYAPYKGVTRAELAKIISKIRGIEDLASSIEYKKIFKDVKKSDWFYPYVMMASGLELVNGYEDGTFKPNQEVTYAELVAILLRNLGYSRLSEDSENGWYWNYLVKMREIELNDNIGEVDYLKPAKRGDVAMFVWNLLITDRWAIAYENEKEGFTYTYSEKTPLEVYFKEYGFLDNAIVNYLGGKEERITIGANYGRFYASEKTPLYVLGGRITALYNINNSELIGVTFDEDYENIEVVSGPKFYLENKGYKINQALKSAYYGNKEDANYVYLVFNKDKNQMIRAVYIDASNSIYVDDISIKETDESGDISEIKKIKINGEEQSSMNFALMEDSFTKGIGNIKKGDVITNLGRGLFVKSSKSLTGNINSINRSSKKIIIDEDEYIVSKNCKCYLYKEKEPVTFNSLTSEELKEYLNKKVTVKLNVAEEICVINFGKTDAQNERYKIGFVTNVYYLPDETLERIEIHYGENKSKRLEIKIAGDDFYRKGDLVSYDTEKNEVKLINKDITLDNDISVISNYNAKIVKHPLIGEYMVNDDTRYYKVSLNYENNSITSIDSVEITDLKINELDDLLSYNITLVYNEDMDVIKVFAINEINKFSNQIALIREIKSSFDEDAKETVKATLSVMGDSIKRYEITKDFEKYVEGEVITFTYDGKDENRKVYLEEAFKKEFIGYQRDLIVKSFDKKENKVIFENGNAMMLNEDVYNFNGNKINLNRYRFVIAKVSAKEDGYKFTDLEMYPKEKLDIKVGDRFAIGELQDVIVIYRGYEE